MKQHFSHILACLSVCLLLAACSSGPEIPQFETQGATLAPKKATSKPYQINGVWYYPQPHYEYAEEGIASYYGGGDVFHGRPTATGERYDMNGITAAHKTVPLPCIAKVTNLENGRELIVKVNDRGPFISGRIIDVSRRSAQLLGFEGKGLAKVRVVTLVPESLALNGIDSPKVMLAEAPTAPVMMPVAAPQDPDTLFDALEGGSSESEGKRAPAPVALCAAPAPVVLAAAPSASAPVTIVEAPAVPDTSVVSSPAPPIDSEPVNIAEMFSSSPAAYKNQASQQPVKLSSPLSTGIFVYVGEYETQSKAQAFMRSLEGFAEAPLTVVKNRGPKPYAASFGPLPSMSYANEVLDQLMNAGHLIARIVIQH